MLGTRFLVGCGVAAITLASSASVAAPVRPAPVKPAEAALPPPQLSLNVSVDSGGALWRFRLENKSNGPVRIPADALLFSFDLTPPATADVGDASAKKKPAAPRPVRCILPDDTRPSSDEGHDLVIPEARSWSGTLDPIFYCFGAKERAALVPGTSVKASFGFPTRAGARAAASPPFAATPVGASTGRMSPAKVVEADAFTLADAPPLARSGGRSDGPMSAADGKPSSVALSVPDSLDAGRGVELGTTVTLTNGGTSSVVVLFRPDMMLFTVSGPGGGTTCGFPRQGAVPIRELFTTVGAKQRTEIGVLFSATCSAGTFDVPGIYRVWPRLDTTGVSGRSLGMKTWDGVAVGKTPLLVRVRAPRRPTPAVRPTLD